ncbi:MAG TPA: hypothetical protein VKX45_06960 [Bryobacteraceae bacterium]|jgi:hypothetical protein|nr:hypothetical protein [Bryobacteraceae bacterium]
MMETEARDWKSALEILSLDFARPVYRELGVGIQNEETIRGISRDALLGRYSLPESLEATPPPEVTTEEGVEPLLPAVARILGDKAARQLGYWVRYTACSESDNPWTEYERLFFAWAGTLRRLGRDDFRLTTDPAIVASQLHWMTNLESSKGILSRQRTKPLSDWDLPLFSRMGLFETPAGSDYFPYVDAIMLTIGLAQFQRFWLWLLPRLKPADLASIGLLAEQRAHSKMRHTLPEELPLPDAR